MKKIAVILILTTISLAACTPDERPEKKGSGSVGKEQLTAEASYSLNNYSYDIDTVSGATTGNHKGTAYTGDEKAKRMHWSGRPEVGIVVGDYYHDELSFDGGYMASMDVIKEGDNIIGVEFDEKAPDTYYSDMWAGQTKRLSGYADFQAENSRTDITLVTLVNAMTFLEYQMKEANSLTGDFLSVKGASNSVRNGYIPLAEQLSGQLASDSAERYFGITKELSDGLYGRLIVITEKLSNKMVEVRYDEFFGDTSESIEDDQLKQYRRQSKYHSVTYAGESGQNFKKVTDTFTKEIVDKQSLEVKVADAEVEKNYAEFIEDMSALIDKNNN